MPQIVVLAYHEVEPEAGQPLQTVSPEFLRDLKPIADACHTKGALLIAVFTEVVSLGLVTSPGEQGADLARDGGPRGRSGRRVRARLPRRARRLSSNPR